MASRAVPDQCDACVFQVDPTGERILFQALTGALDDQLGHARMQSKGLGIENLSLLKMEGGGQVFQGSFSQAQRLWEYLFSEKACTHEQGQDNNLPALATFQGVMHRGVVFVKATSDFTKKGFFPQGVGQPLPGFSGAVVLCGAMSGKKKRRLM